MIILVKGELFNLNTYQRTIAIFIILAGISAVVKFQNESDNSYNYHTISYYQVYSLNKPNKITFCGEEVPVRLPAVQEKIDREIFHYNSLRRSTHSIIKRVNIWFPKIEKILVQEGLPKDLKYLAVVESNLRNAVSHKGAVGFWQFMEPTAISMGLQVDSLVDERNNPEKATRAACKYFKIAHKHFNNWASSAASYNMGITGLQRRMNVQQKNSYYELKLNKETSQYVYRAIALKEIIENKGKYGFEEQHYHEPLNTPEAEHKLLNILFTH